MCIFGSEAMRGRGRGRSRTFKLPDVEVMRPYRARSTAHWTLCKRPEELAGSVLGPRHSGEGVLTPVVGVLRSVCGLSSAQIGYGAHGTRHAPPRLPHRVFSELLARACQGLASAMQDHAVARGGERAPYVRGGMRMLRPEGSWVHRTRRRGVCRVWQSFYLLFGSLACRLELRA
ncbi:hypothetical protein OH76DRAFT_830695 [Lentinus brumalis]|uniref:Uncharacterized protein n=1 Tax=Lentinus brumalis TaxID=2498619 RepID=A0A371D1T4_9APHY|nr:hypothetical protein OH76DRAFT_830695 [Polyporus brumalis]